MTRGSDGNERSPANAAKKVPESLRLEAVQRAESGQFGTAKKPQVQMPWNLPVFGLFRGCIDRFVELSAVWYRR
jgi:hypothetical protein